MWDVLRKYDYVDVHQFAWNNVERINFTHPLLPSISAVQSWWRRWWCKILQQYTTTVVNKSNNTNIILSEKQMEKRCFMTPLIVCLWEMLKFTSHCFVAIGSYTSSAKLEITATSLLIEWLNNTKSLVAFIINVKFLRKANAFIWLLLHQLILLKDFNSCFSYQNHNSFADKKSHILPRKRKRPVVIKTNRIVFKKKLWHPESDTD